MKYTVKIWTDLKHYKAGDAEVIGTEMSEMLAMDVANALDDWGRFYAIEVFETESGETIFHSLD